MMRVVSHLAACTLAAATLTATTLVAQSTIADRVNAVRDGRVVLHYETRPDVCGSESGDGFRSTGSQHGATSDGWTRDNRDCVHGPAWVTLTRSGGSTISVHMRVGYRPSHEPTDTDLGEVASADASHFLIASARTLGTSNAERALSAAAVADAPSSGPDFLALAESANVQVDIRKQALFWAGQSELPAEQLVGAYASLRDRDLREHFAFVLSQRHDTPAIDKLMDIAQHDDDSQVKRQAIFWLGQSRDPRAKQFLVDLIMR